MIIKWHGFTVFIRNDRNFTNTPLDVDGEMIYYIDDEEVVMILSTEIEDLKKRWFTLYETKNLEVRLDIHDMSLDVFVIGLINCKKL